MNKHALFNCRDIKHEPYQRHLNLFNTGNPSQAIWLQINGHKIRTNPMSKKKKLQDCVKTKILYDKQQLNINISSVSIRIFVINARRS